MKKVVLDTNIIVSALWSEAGKPARIFEMFLKGEITICYDCRILIEYKEVLNRPGLAFKRTKIGNIINRIRNDGIAIVAQSCDLPFVDEDDRMFYEVAKECGAVLITGNIRHYPTSPFIMTVTDFLMEK